MWPVLASSKPFRLFHQTKDEPMGKHIAILVARLIFAAIFLMAAGFKFAGMQMTADYIAAAGFPFPLVLAWVAAIFEVLLALAFLTGAFFSEAALLAGAYVRSEEHTS